MAYLIDGKTYAKILRSTLKEELAATDFHPSLAVILVGDDKPSQTYVGLKKKASLAIGMHFHDYLMSKMAATGDVIQAVNFLNDDEEIDGIVVQLPLPEGIETDEVTKAINPALDVDGFHPDNIRQFLGGDKNALAPGLAEGILRLIELPGEKIKGKHAVIVAKSPVFVETLAKLLSDREVDVEWVKPTALDLAERCRSGHILIAAAGKAGLITDEHIRPGSTIIDMGFNYLEDGSLVGDVEYNKVASEVGWITPVPGGVGPMTVAMLLWRTYQLACRRHGLPMPEIPMVTMADIIAEQKKALTK